MSQGDIIAHADSLVGAGPASSMHVGSPEVPVLALTGFNISKKWLILKSDARTALVQECPFMGHIWQVLLMPSIKHTVLI